MQRTNRLSVFLCPLFIVLIINLGISTARADLNNYGPVADAIQSSTYSRFLSADGLYFLQNNGGHTGFNYWWNAHGVDAFIDAYQRTRNATYLTRAKNLLHGIRAKNGNTYNNTFYDDMEWLGLSSLRAYEISGDAEYLAVAEELWGRIKTGYSSGLFSWNTSCHPNCKNTIGSTPAIVLGARLYSLGRISAADRTMHVHRRGSRTL
jgi:predicted alpha-1,6-mannanase (GH76 family)